MILYSIIPEEVIYDQDKDNNSNIKDVVLDSGVILELEHCNEGIYKLVRVVSTNPSDYLKDIYQPGINIRISNLI